MRPVTRRFAALFVLATMAACSAGDPPPEAPAATADPGASAPAPAPATARDEAPADFDVVAESLPYAEDNDELVYGHFAFPADMVDPLPAVLLVHDRWGLNDDIRQAAERLAANGYIVLAVDLFLGKTVNSVTEARDLEIDVLENPGRVQDNISQAIEFVRVSSGPPGLAILGFGLGGGLAMNAALDHPADLEAIVSFYGQPLSDDGDIARLEVPFQGFYAESDRAVPLSTVEEFQAIAEELGKDVDIEVMAAARRGFAEASGETYDAEALDSAWEQMLEFLGAAFDASR